MDSGPEDELLKVCLSHHLQQELERLTWKWLKVQVQPLELLVTTRNQGAQLLIKAPCGAASEESPPGEAIPVPEENPDHVSSSCFRLTLDQFEADVSSLETHLDKVPLSLMTLKVLTRCWVQPPFTDGDKPSDVKHHIVTLCSDCF